jgi:tRNA pseudouridine38-40 synthase
MRRRSVQLVLHYDGAEFAGWQRQAAVRTVQGVLESAASRICNEPVAVVGAGRTDAGVHALGQAAGIRVAERWEPMALRRALNAVLPPDVWVTAAHEMDEAFHARFSATARRYRYAVGLDDEARSPFRRRWEWAFPRAIDAERLAAETTALAGEHSFRAFAVRGTAPAHDDHRCVVHQARWEAVGPRLSFLVEANRFLPHMVRFLVGTLLDVASGRREPGTVPRLLGAASNDDVSPPAPAHALFLERVTYPAHLYLTTPS